LRTPAIQPLAVPASNVPEPARMNSNRFPILDPKTASTFAAEPVYQKRHIPEVMEKMDRKLNAKQPKKITKPVPITKAEPLTKPTAARPKSPGTLDLMLLEGLQKDVLEKQQEMEKVAARVAEYQERKRRQM
jgi:hypothetical protein